VSQQPPTGPDFAAPGFSGCYRHPERITGITCQRCRRPICGECMRPASVGFQCPNCVTEGRSRATRSGFGAVLKPGGGTATKIVMVVLAVVYVIDLITRGLASGLLVMATDFVELGQFWRLLTAALVSGSLLGLLMNLLVLWLAGRALESELGGWRFLVLYLAAGLGGSTVFFLLGPPGGAVITAGSAVIGLLAANAVGKLKNSEDIRPDVGLLILIVLYSVLIGFSSMGWLTLIGGIAVGAIVGYLLSYGPRRNRNVRQVVGLLGVVLICLVAVVARSLVWPA
jgi:membrane associated rhomboid family serine protease